VDHDVKGSTTTTTATTTNNNNIINIIIIIYINNQQCPLTRNHAQAAVILQIQTLGEFRDRAPRGAPPSALLLCSVVCPNRALAEKAS